MYSWATWFVLVLSFAISAGTVVAARRERERWLEQERERRR